MQALFWEDVLDHERGIVRYRRAVVRGAWSLQGTYEVVDRDSRTVRKKKLRLVFLNSMSGKPFYENALRERFWKVHLENAGCGIAGRTSAGSSSARC
ncbi:hypothetical protein MHM84_14090 [Halomonas sp. McH1-25]|uniref:hypothetical protein n=1 Tax=unclassified Halomonas TaxID=2609666 RepID=UPI001EF480EC|nr:MULTISPECIES: hypothetical protein [unclassified Halomonas]MCG7600917.1 hypothetical protein [Halomonas sp. McH1-25]MCP1341505.1 hypothetical protein [Halomonas sp. FL8]MCP1360096.1 hypothetical protein [Halomonas sp. BBD45]MCP1364414.1 hypothetical protein [Halomonas sp. BBD48]